MPGKGSVMDQREAARTLNEIRMTRGALARRARWSLPRHGIVGLMAGSMIAGYALPDGWPVAIAVACLIGTAMVVVRDRRRDGFFVNGYRPGRTRWLTIGIAVLTCGALFGAIVLKARYDLCWAPIVIGVVMVIIVTGTSIAWERVYRQELEGTSGER